jgi:CheY-like chemotaxis protein
MAGVPAGTGAPGASFPVGAAAGPGAPPDHASAERFRCAGDVASVSPSATATGGSALGNITSHSSGGVRAPRAHAPIRVLYVGGDPRCRHLHLEYLGHLAGVAVRTAADTTTALAVVRRARPSIVVVDAGGEPVDALVQAIVTLDASLPVVVCSADAHEATAGRYLHLGAAAHLPKPFDLARLEGVLRSLARREVVNPFAPSGRHEEGSSTNAHATAASWN